MADSIYGHVPFAPAELQQRYGPRIHLLRDPYLLTQLARLCSPATVQPEFNRLVRALYRGLASVAMAAELPRRRAEIPTRMAASTPHGVYVGEVIEASTKAVVVGVARAGTLPAMLVFEALNHVLDPAGVRQDHVVMSRTTDDETGAVTGVTMSTSKVAGDAADSILFIPDPMGATGGSMCAAIDLYARVGARHPLKIIIMCLIVTPQFIRRVQRAHPQAILYAVRLDRGLSAPDVLATIPGERWDEENGLNEVQYIVPGGGGFGELMNNAYV